MKKIAFIITTLFVIIVFNFLQSCSSEESVISVDSKIKTVSKEEAILYLKNGETSLEITAKNKFLYFDFGKITQEKLTNTTEFLTVVPVIVKDKKQRIFALLLKIENKIENILYKEYPDDSSTINSFSGVIIMTKLNGEFIRGYRLKQNEYVAEFIKNKESKLGKTITSREVFATEPNQLEEVIVNNNYKKPKYKYVPMEFKGPDVSDEIELWWMMSGGGYTSTEGIEEDAPDEDFAPSCESFVFTSKSGANWQEAAVKNIHFDVILLSQNGYRFLHKVDYPNAILFGTPNELSVGNTIISPELAASLSAKALAKSMSETVEHFGNTEASDLSVKIYFEARLKHNYPLYIPGGRVIFNAANYSVKATEYKTNLFGTGNCN